MTVRLFLTGKFLPNYVEAGFASRRLPPKAAVSAYRRHSFVEGIRNGGLDFVKAAERSSVGHGDCLLNDGFFSFAVVRQIDRIYLSVMIGLARCFVPHPRLCSRIEPFSVRHTLDAVPPALGWLSANKLRAHWESPPREYIHNPSYQ